VRSQLNEMQTVSRVGERSPIRRCCTLMRDESVFREVKTDSTTLHHRLNPVGNEGALPNGNRSFVRRRELRSGESEEISRSIRTMRPANSNWRNSGPLRSRRRLSIVINVAHMLPQLFPCGSSEFGRFSSVGGIGAPSWFEGADHYF